MKTAVLKRVDTTIHSEQEKIKRLLFLDSLRGVTLLNMICYHTLWDIEYIFGVDIPFFGGISSYIYQQFICWTFIVLSGFCFNLGNHHIRRGITVFICGMITSLVTIIFTPQNPVIFGILTFLGLAMLIMYPLEKITNQINPIAGLIISILIFILTRNVPRGNLGFEKITLFELPDKLYQGYLASLIGFKDNSFYSADYFSLIPWLFLFIFGYFIGRVFKDKLNSLSVMKIGAEPFNFIGRNSLIIYMIHQPLIYLILYLIFLI